MDEANVLNTLLEQKLQLLDTVANVGMLWWVSSVVFCGSALGGIWIKRHEIASAPFFGWLGLLLGVFFVSIVLFGIWMVVAVGMIQQETEVILAAQHLTQYSQHFGFLAVQVGYGIGTTSFVIVTIIWGLLWRTIIREHEQPLGNRPNIYMTAPVKRTRPNGVDD